MLRALIGSPPPELPNDNLIVELASRRVNVTSVICYW
jgi:hypothetical protein